MSAVVFEALTGKKLVEKYYAIFQNGFKASPLIEYDATCACGWNRNYLSKHGYTNLVRYIDCCHPEHKTIFNGSDTSQKKLEGFLYTAKTKTYYEWLHWTISKLYPFTFVESEVDRLYSKLDLMSVDAFMSMMDELSFAVEIMIAELLPDLFALVFDGWSLGDTHYVGHYSRQITLR